MAEKSQLDVILQADAIRPPLTGIGRYAWELAKGLGVHPEVGRLRFFSRASWVDHLADPERPSVSSAVSLKSQIRGALSANPLAVGMVKRIVPAVAGWRLRNEPKGSIYHSPNYFLPKFPGRCVATIHDLSHELFPQYHPQARVEYMRRAMPQTLRRADHLITDTEAVRQEVIRQYDWPVEKITAIHLGVDDVFHPRPMEELEPVLAKHGLKPGAYALYIGTIEPRKNVDGLLDAYELLPAALRAKMPLILAGSPGWNSERTHARMVKAAQQGWLKYLRFVPQADLPFLYAGAKLFAFPSFYEGFGLPVAEALASGTPVIISDNASLQEVAEGCAVTVDVQDAHGFRDALAGLLLADESLPRTGLKTFPWQLCVDEVVQVFRSLR